MIGQPPRSAIFKKQNQRGFTLIEIVVVVVVMAILAALAIPNLSSQDDLTASSTARMVLADLLYAQSQAIESGVPEVVSFTVANGSGNGDGGGYSLAGLTNPVTLLPYNRSFGLGAPSPFSAAAIAGVMLGAPSSTEVTFGPLGQPVGLTSQGVIELQCGAMIEKVLIEPDTGNITISP